MKHTNEVQAILTAIFAINRTSEHEDKDITLVLDYAFRELGNNNYLVDYRGVKCSAIFNPFNCTYYADDIYGRTDNE